MSNEGWVEVGAPAHWRGRLSGADLGVSRVPLFKTCRRHLRHLTTSRAVVSRKPVHDVSHRWWMSLFSFSFSFFSLFLLLPAPGLWRTLAASSTRMKKQPKWWIHLHFFGVLLLLLLLLMLSYGASSWLWWMLNWLWLKCFRGWVAAFQVARFFHRCYRGSFNVLHPEWSDGVILCNFPYHALVKIQKKEKNDSELEDWRVEAGIDSCF